MPPSASSSLADRAHAPADSSAQRILASHLAGSASQAPSRCVDVEAVLVTLFEARSPGSGLRSAAGVGARSAAEGGCASGSRSRSAGLGICDAMAVALGRPSGPARRKPRVLSRLAIGCGVSPQSGQPVTWAAAAGVKRRRQRRQQTWRIARDHAGFFAGRLCAHTGHTRSLRLVCSLVGELEVRAVTSESRHALNVRALRQP